MSSTTFASTSSEKVWARSNLPSAAESAAREIEARELLVEGAWSSNHRETSWACAASRWSRAWRNAATWAGASPKAPASRRSMPAVMARSNAT